MAVRLSHGDRRATAFWNQNSGRDNSVGSLSAMYANNRKIDPHVLRSWIFFALPLVPALRVCQGQLLCMVSSSHKEMNFISRLDVNFLDSTQNIYKVSGA